MMFLIKTLMFLMSVFLVLLVLVQRGRGGGLAGALGGMGGQSVFGSKAGDVFTRVTIVVAAVWILLCAYSVKHFRPEPTSQFAKTQTQGIKAGSEPGLPAPTPTGTASTAAAPAATAVPATPPAATGGK